LRTPGIPEFAACRRLVVRGINGRLEVWRAGKAYPDMIIPDIEKGTPWTVEESDTVGPSIARWEPFPGHVCQDVVFREGQLAPAAKNLLMG
jgi:hypothetical protein